MASITEWDEYQAYCLEKRKGRHVPLPFDRWLALETGIPLPKQQDMNQEIDDRQLEINAKIAELKVLKNDIKKPSLFKRLFGKKTIEAKEMVKIPVKQENVESNDIRAKVGAETAREETEQANKTVEHDAINQPEDTQKEQSITSVTDLLEPELAKAVQQSGFAVSQLIVMGLNSEERRMFVSEYRIKQLEDTMNGIIAKIGEAKR